jgi:molecular chaperone GrpE
LEDAGLRQFGQIGEDFNPELHEAVLVAECDPEGDGRLLEVWQPGYTFDGKLLRPARVKVGRARRTENQM